VNISKKRIVFLFNSILWGSLCLCYLFVVNLLNSFKDKDVVHWSIFTVAILVAVLAGHQIKRRIGSSRNRVLSLISLVLLSLILVITPGLIYILIPQTFYFAGIALLLLISVGILAGLSHHNIDKFSYGAVPAGLILGISTFILTDVPLNLIILRILIVCLMVLSALLPISGRRYFVDTSIAMLVITGVAFSFKYYPKIQLFENQHRYEDQIVFHAKTQFHDLTVTKWKDDYWIYLDNLKNLSTADEFLFYEPMVHPAMNLAAGQQQVLILGGENGCALREVLKFDGVQHVAVVSYDSTLRNLASRNSIFINMNKGAYQDTRVEIIDRDLLDFISRDSSRFDAIVVDLPDPRNIYTNQFYTREFYTFCRSRLKKGGVIVTQGGSPYFATKAFYSIEQSMNVAGFETMPIHNQILTLGEWGWILGFRDISMNEAKNVLQNHTFEKPPTIWLNNEAVRQIMAFGKNSYAGDNLIINTLENPVLYEFYLQGNWELDN
jgi:spermidine synthase